MHKGVEVLVRELQGVVATKNVKVHEFAERLKALRDAVQVVRVHVIVIREVEKGVLLHLHGFAIDGNFRHARLPNARRRVVPHDAKELFVQFVIAGGHSGVFGAADEALVEEPNVEGEHGVFAAQRAGHATRAVPNAVVAVKTRA